MFAREEFFVYLVLCNYLLFSKYRTRMWVNVLLSVNIMIGNIPPSVMDINFSCPFSEKFNGFVKYLMMAIWTP